MPIPERWKPLSSPSIQAVTERFSEENGSTTPLSISTRPRATWEVRTWSEVAAAAAAAVAAVRVGAVVAVAGRKQSFLSCELLETVEHSK